MYTYVKYTGRYIIEIHPNDLDKVIKVLNENSVHYEKLGKIIEKHMTINQKTNITIDELKSYNTNWLTNYMSS